MKNSTAILGAIVIAFAINAQAMRFGALERPREENLALQRVVYSAHLSLNRVLSKNFRSARGKTRQLPQNAIEDTRATSYAYLLKYAGMAFRAPVSSASPLRGHSASSRAPPLV